MIKLAVAGKGGVGKTTVAGTIARFLARDGFNVLAVDADPDLNLGSVLGVDTSNVTPMADKTELISERTGVAPGGISVPGVFKLNPKIDDIVELYGVPAPDEVNLVVMGTVDEGGSGCMCPAGAFLRALMRHLVKRKKDAIILDMEAGIEHLSRGIADSMDLMIVVVEPGKKSVETARRTKKLAGDIGISDIKGVINKVRSEDEAELIHKWLEDVGMPVIGTIPYDEAFVQADLNDVSPLDYSKSSKGIRAIYEIERKIIDSELN